MKLLFTQFLPTSYHFIPLPGHYVTPRSSPGRMVYFTSHMCASVLLAGYAGNYISVLSGGRPLVLPFTTFRGMLHDGSYLLGAMPRSAQLDYFDVRICEMEFLNFIFYGSYT
jgi:hypothetical protein